MDGTLDAPVWQGAPLVSGFIRYDKPEPVEVQTSFRVLYDADYLYFGVRCDEPLMDKLSATACARDDAAVFHGECLEFFIDPNHTHDLYYQLGVNAAGSLYDSERTNPVWNSESKVAAHLDKDCWSVELAIPWKALKVEPKPGAIIGFNVCRDRYLGASRSWSCWSQVNANFHDPDRFAHLVLSSTPEMIARMGADLRKGGRTGPITVFSAEGFAQTTYAELAKRTLDDLDKIIADMEAVRKSETDPAAAAELAMSFWICWSILIQEAASSLPWACARRSAASLR
jgi:hypothetical protein